MKVNQVKLIQYKEGDTYSDYCLAPDEITQEWIDWLHKHGVYQWRTILRRTTIDEIIQEYSEPE